MTQQIPLHTLLGDRYKVTAHILDTADGDAILDGTDQVLNRKVSIVVAAPTNNSKLVANARSSATSSRSAVQILDLGNSGDSTYLITSHARPDTLLDTLLADSGAGEAEKFGEEIFGDTGTLDAPNTYVVAKETAAPAAAGAGATISATRPAPAAAEEPVEEYEEYDAEEDGYYEAEETTERNGGMWVVGIAAILLLVIAAGAVFASLGKMVDTDASKEALGGNDKTASATSSEETTEKATAEASPTTEEKKLATPKLDGAFTRTVPSSPTLMAESDAILAQMTDGNTATTWLSLAFGSANFGGLTDSFYLSGKLDEATTVNSVTINQISGTGGAFTIYASDSASINGATEVGSGTFAATGETTVKLNTDKQDGDTEYIIIQFTEAPLLSQPIVAGYPYGLRIADINVK